MLDVPPVVRGAYAVVPWSALVGRVHIVVAVVKDLFVVALLQRTVWCGVYGVGVVWCGVVWCGVYGVSVVWCG